MKDYFHLDGVPCVGKFFDDEIPGDIVIIDHRESSWGDVLTKYLPKLEYDYVISLTSYDNIAFKKWTIPQKLKVYNRERRLKELGI
jgi:hypothetical protein